MDAQTSNTLAELNEDCEILIHNRVENSLVDYARRPIGPPRVEELEMHTPEMQQLYFAAPRAIEMKERSPKMMPSTSSAGMMKAPKIMARKSFGEDSKPKIFVDEPVQATDEKYMVVPRSTVLSRTRKHLSKRNSWGQSVEIKYRTIKIQTDNSDQHNVGVSVEPLDFLGMFEKSTNVPLSRNPGATKEQFTQMYEHVTQSELFCIEWIHKNLFTVKLSPNTLVVDDKIRDASESACLT